jgi:hypothetical protein
MTNVFEARSQKGKLINSNKTVRSELFDFPKLLILHLFGKLPPVACTPAAARSRLAYAVHAKHLPIIGQET